MGKSYSKTKPEDPSELTYNNLERIRRLPPFYTGIRSNTVFPISQTPAQVTPAIIVATQIPAQVTPDIIVASQNSRSPIPSIISSFSTSTPSQPASSSTPSTISSLPTLIDPSTANSAVSSNSNSRDSAFTELSQSRRLRTSPIP